MGAHGSSAVGYKILYTNWRFRFIQGFYGCYVLGSELVLKLHLQLICVHISDVEAEVAVLHPVPGFSAVSAGVRGGFGLLGHIYVHQDRIVWGRIEVGKACGRGSLSRLGDHWNVARGGSWNVGLPVGGVKGLVRHAVLVHLDGKAEPGFGIRV